MPTKAYTKYDDLVKAVAKQTKTDETLVRKILTASFPSTKAFVVAEIKRLSSGLRLAKGGGDEV
jgi:hypothetical protein